MDFTSNDVIDGIEMGDNTVEIVGYVDAIERPKIVGKIKKYRVMKFIVNNDAGRRIQCVAWETQVARMLPIVQLNKILHIDGASSKKIEKPAFNTGNATFELSVNANTEVVVVGDHGNGEEENQPRFVGWENVADATGTIKIQGHVKTKFARAESRSQDGSYGLGAITNGVMKIEVRIADYVGDQLNYEKGDPIEVVGTVNWGTHMFLKVADASAITLIEGPRLTFNQMRNIIETPRKMQRLDG